MNKEQARQEIRTDMRRILSNLDRRWILAASHRLNERLVSLIENRTKSGQAVDAILAWVPFFPGEVDLSSLISEQITKRSIFLPRLLPERQMDFLRIGANWNIEMASNSAASLSRSSIPEPGHESGDRYDLAALDSTVIIVPGLAFDSSGNRLGRGKGYYDRYLGSLPDSNVKRIGVCWSFQLVDKIPVFPHDVAMDCIVTEKECVGEF